MTSTIHNKKFIEESQTLFDEQDAVFLCSIAITDGRLIIYKPNKLHFRQLQKILYDSIIEIDKHIKSTTE